MYYDEIKVGDMGRACSTYGRKEEVMHGFGRKKDTTGKT
jgi:hypothetical protein